MVINNVITILIWLNMIKPAFEMIFLSFPLKKLIALTIVYSDQGIY